MESTSSTENFPTNYSTNNNGYNVRVDKIEVDEAKGTVTVTGSADPYEITVRTRKAGKHAEVVSVGPPPPPPKPEAQKKPEEKKAEEKKPEVKKPEQKPLIHDPHSFPHCQPMVVVSMGPSYEPNPVSPCSIM